MLVFHNGVRKSGLMGFADVAPKDDKILRIAYLFEVRLHACVCVYERERDRETERGIVCIYACVHVHVSAIVRRLSVRD